MWMKKTAREIRDENIRSTIYVRNDCYPAKQRRKVKAIDVNFVNNAWVVSFHNYADGRWCLCQPDQIFWVKA